jgi:hypothetical protein
LVSAASTRRLVSLGMDNLRSGSLRSIVRIARW